MHAWPDTCTSGLMLGWVRAHLGAWMSAQLGACTAGCVHNWMCVWLELCTSTSGCLPGWVNAQLAACTSGCVHNSVPACLGPRTSGPTHGCSAAWSRGCGALGPSPSVRPSVRRFIGAAELDSFASRRDSASWMINFSLPPPPAPPGRARRLLPPLAPLLRPPRLLGEFGGCSHPPHPQIPLPRPHSMRGTGLRSGGGGRVVPAASRGVGVPRQPPGDPHGSPRWQRCPPRPPTPRHGWDPAPGRLPAGWDGAGAGLTLSPVPGAGTPCPGVWLRPRGGDGARIPTAVSPCPHGHREGTAVPAGAGAPRDGMGTPARGGHPGLCPQTPLCPGSGRKTNKQAPPLVGPTVTPRGAQGGGSPAPRPLLRLGGLIWAL